MAPVPSRSARVQREDCHLEPLCRSLYGPGKWREFVPAQSLCRALSTVLATAMERMGSALGPGDSSAHVALLTSQHRTPT